MYGWPGKNGQSVNLEYQLYQLGMGQNHSKPMRLPYIWGNNNPLTIAIFVYRLGTRVLIHNQLTVSCWHSWPSKSVVMFPFPSTLHKSIWLVVPTPLKNMSSSVEVTIPCIWKNKSYVPNHQPVNLSGFLLSQKLNSQGKSNNFSNWIVEHTLSWKIIYWIIYGTHHRYG